MTFKYFTSSLFFFINYRKIQFNQPTSMMNFCLKNVKIIRMVWNVNKSVATASMKNSATMLTEVVQTDVTLDHMEACVIKV